MTTAAKLLFTGKTHVTSGPDGAAHANDGSLDIKLAQPHPAAENLFAAAWSACYLGALGLAAAQRKVKLPSEPSVDTTIDLSNANGAFFLRARLDVSVPGVDRAVRPGVDRGGARHLPLLQGRPRQHRGDHHPRLTRHTRRDDQANIRSRP
ncbi:organic hydroperoxide reductase OsmC/OhrA [Bradyrhizobium japonicum]